MTTKDSSRIRRIRQSSLIRGLWLFLTLILVVSNPSHAQGQASFTVADHSFQVHCAAINRPAVAIIHWVSGGEDNVSTYKVHRTRVTGTVENRWVNRFPLTAMGPGSTYRIIDSETMPGVIYRYRVYGFEESGRLSLTTWITLDEGMRPSCSYYPIIHRGSAG
jgi:hypothetical protein